MFAIKNENVRGINMAHYYLDLAETALEKFSKAQDRTRAEFFWKEFQYWNNKWKQEVRDAIDE